MTQPNQTGINQAYQIQESLAHLEEGLNNQAPGLATLLRDIHTQLKKDPEVVTLLSEEECSILVRGLKKQTATDIATTSLKKGGRKAMSKMTTADL